MDADEDDDTTRLGKTLRIAVPAVLVVGVGFGIWSLLHDTAGMRREAPPLPMIQAMAPPPPPPPPKEKPPEPEKKVEEQQKSDPTPKQDKVDAPRPVTINGPAQAGGDAFNIGAGDGGGSVGGVGGVGNESYGRYLSGALQTAIEQDDRLNHLAFNAQIVASIDANRKLRVRILHSSGDAKIDDMIVSAAEQTALQEEAPGALEFRIAIHSKRPA